MKVYGWNHGGTARRIVAAKSWKEAHAAQDTPRGSCSLHHMRTYGAITCNDDEEAIALSSPGTVFEKTTLIPGVWKEVNQ